MTDARSAARTGLVFHDRYLQHNTGLARTGSPMQPYPYAEPEPHISSPRTVERSKHLLDLSGLGAQLATLPARYATEDELRYVHTADHVARVQAVAAGGGGDAGVNAPLGADGYDIARLAVGGALAAVDGVLSGAVDTAYALVRPPGHHATPDRAMGFCIFNNIAIAARHAQRQHGLPPDRHPRLGCPPRQRHARRLLRRPRRALHLAAPGRALPGRDRRGR